MDLTSKELIKRLQLLPHPEGGYYREMYRSTECLINENKEKSLCTSIFYLLEDNDKSALHRIGSDELWFFHQGASLEIVSIQAGKPHRIILGNNVTEGEVPQVLIPKNTWFGAKLESGSGYSLVSCTVAPGFDFEDFELARRTALKNEFPHLEELINEFTNG